MPGDKTSPTTQHQVRESRRAGGQEYASFHVNRRAGGVHQGLVRSKSEYGKRAAPFLLPAMRRPCFSGFVTGTAGCRGTLPLPQQSMMAHHARKLI